MGGRPHRAAADPVHHHRRRPPGAAARERSHVCARRRAQEARGAEGLRPLRGLWRRRLPPGDGGDAGVVWDASTGAVRASFWRATVDEVRFVPKSVTAGWALTVRGSLLRWRRSISSFALA